jgi:hypothetical protein
MLFWVFPRGQIVVFRRFGTLCQLNLQRLYEANPAFEDGTDRGFRNVGKPQSDAGDLQRLDVENQAFEDGTDRGFRNVGKTQSDAGDLQRLDVENQACEDGTDRGCRTVGKTQSDAGEIPKRTYTIYLSIYFCLTCFGLSFSPSSEAGVQLRQWYKSAGYGVSARALTQYHCRCCISASEDGLTESPKHVRQK